MSKIKFSRKMLSIPYAVFMILFVVIPLLLVIFYAFTDAEGHFSFGNVVTFFSNSTNLNTFIISVLIGVFTTAISLVIGYPVAYILTKKEFKFGGIFVLLFIMPMWINFVLRTAATRDVLFWLGISGGEKPYLATMIGMVYNYLPFVILPLYTTMLKMDHSLIEASMDLGASKTQTFVKTIIPMTMPGIVSAASMVFMPTMSSYVISDVMGERQISLIGNTIQTYFDKSLWNLGSFIALVMIAIILVTSFLTRNVEKQEDARGGLW